MAADADHCPRDCRNGDPGGSYEGESRVIDLRHLDYQKHAFADRLNRYDLTKLKGGRDREKHVIRVSRNHGFEQVASVLPSFLAISELNITVEISDYDDSLALPPSDAQVEVVWLDFNRYARLDDKSVADWLLGQLKALRARAACQSSSPMIRPNSARRKN